MILRVLVKIYFWWFTWNRKKPNFAPLSDIALSVVERALTHGVIGNTSVFGTDILGSSPSGSTQITKQLIDYQWVVFVLSMLVVDNVVDIPSLTTKTLSSGYFNMNCDRFDLSSGSTPYGSSPNLPWISLVLIVLITPILMREVFLNPVLLNPESESLIR